MANIPTAIPGPAATPPRYGLLIAADVVTDDPGGAVRWFDGVTWDPEACSGGGTADVACGSTLDDLSPGQNRSNLEALPFLVWGADGCTTIGFQERDYEARARRLLDATQSFHIARELWTGTQVTSNPALADVSADTVTTSAVSIATAIARVDGALAACMNGRRGMIHMPAQLLTEALAAQVVYQSGQQWLTALGTIVVADAGYPGTGPNGEPASTSQWIYGTPLVSVRLGPVDVVPGSLADARNMAAAMVVNLNDVEVRAQRLALVQWDTCCLFAAQVNITAPAVGGTS